MTDRADILVFDVNETLLDLTTLDPLFERLFGGGRARALWFSQMILYSNAATLAGAYAAFPDLAKGALRMMGETEGVAISDADTEELLHLITHMPACADAVPALTRLRAAGVRMVTLTNSPPAESPTPMERAGIAEFFEAHYSVADVRRFKPAPECYQLVCDHLQVAPARLCLVAAHLWDTLGMQALGGEGAFITRPGNALFPSGAVAKPTYIAPDLGVFADAWLSR
ncbi:haloacid dehalogenase type II [Salipiger sp. IMCC34102]|uniref:haloacid dehalogenase type II n=1 Tax=Salipiger sp. IMCC34102 TaxID=2510647 RepID=UPI00101BC417|nr:haloacid dehalogenase type II [Salipiger sp. IMCC34102]RYH01409.1 haloacid dehalogenase type II [Salipiger sp. IMCC34102]